MSSHPVSGDAVREAYEYCEKMARAHYENFPVASLFIPSDKRRFIWSIYAFARTADDFADEGTLPERERLARLDDWGRQLEACYRGSASHPVFVALADTAGTTGISYGLLADLLTAFRMDVTTHRYSTFQDLLGYCRFSANPVGRLVLRIFGDDSERNVLLSDSICTALQLTNFWQDAAIDRQKGRIYMPLEDMRRFGYTESDLAQNVVDARFRELLKFQVDRTYVLFRAGAPLVSEATPRLRFELGLTLNGGMTILRKIERASYDVLHGRPELTVGDIARVFLVSLFHKTV